MNAVGLKLEDWFLYMLSGFLIGVASGFLLIPFTANIGFNLWGYVTIVAFLVLGIVTFVIAQVADFFKWGTKVLSE